MMLSRDQMMTDEELQEMKLASNYELHFQNLTGTVHVFQSSLRKAVKEIEEYRKLRDFLDMFFPLP